MVHSSSRVLTEEHAIHHLRKPPLGETAAAEEALPPSAGTPRAACSHASSRGSSTSGMPAVSGRRPAAVACSGGASRRRLRLAAAVRLLRERLFARWFAQPTRRHGLHACQARARRHIAAAVGAQERQLQPACKGTGPGAERDAWQQRGSRWCFAESCVPARQAASLAGIAITTLAVHSYLPWRWGGWRRGGTGRPLRLATVVCRFAVRLLLLPALGRQVLFDGQQRCGGQAGGQAAAAGREDGVGGS